MVKHLLRSMEYVTLQDIGKARWRAKRTLPGCPGDRTLRSERRCVRVTELCEVKGDVTIPELKRQQYGHTPLPIYRPEDKCKTRVKRRKEPT